MVRDLLSLLQPLVAGRRAWEDAAAIHAFDRYFTFSKFQESARYSADRLRAAGLEDVEIIQAPADGRSIFGDWMMPLAWEVEAATLDVIPARGRPERIADRTRELTALAMWSAPTPAEGIEAELVWVQDAAQSEPEAVQGRIVFTSALPAHVKGALIRKGAVGILSDYQSPGADLPGAVSWVNAFGDLPGDWGLTRRHSLGWCFKISPCEGAKLRARLAAGERLRGRAVVRSSIQEGTLPTITGVIKGTGRDEVVLIGHQFEQGAVDNASGIAVMLEAARLVQSLIDAGKLARPSRSIRFLFVSECYTTMFWAEHTDRRRMVAGLCLDSPAGVPSLAARPPEIHVNPHSQMSYTDALALALAREVMATAPLYAWGETAYVGMTDNMIADRTIGIPCPWIGGHSRTWHTSADTLEVLDERLLELTALMSAAYAYLIAAADQRLALNFAHLAAARGRTALAQAGLSELERDGEAELADSVGQLDYLAERQAEAVASVLRLVPAGERASLRPYVRGLQRDLRRAGADEAASLARRAGRPGFTPPSFEPTGPLAKVRPRRLVLGPVTLDRVQPEARQGRPSPRWSMELLALLNWCDGRRSLAEACELAGRELRAERALTAQELVSRVDPTTDSMLEYFEFLRRHGYVAW